MTISLPRERAALSQTELSLTGLAFRPRPGTGEHGTVADQAVMDGISVPPSPALSWWDSSPKMVFFPATHHGAEASPMPDMDPRPSGGDHVLDTS
eukprot:CAMPEP_0185744398 /NCGR_PEP_ID=MMETSP1174-20130828/2491_1 /TAXON_ID=35687 /ORGANISM="Dictyocha speculum, Strain CCMP1381" /LENGTH=94 /DNA_ID=CAMNT_0028417767 /DNA_START=371 /DNA_END=653 /DNA_ORIENTATION=+